MQQTADVSYKPLPQRLLPTPRKWVVTAKGRLTHVNVTSIKLPSLYQN